MIKLYFRSILRFIILSYNYKISFLSFSLRCLCYLPFFSYNIERFEDKSDNQKILVGHIKLGKKISIKVFNLTIIKFILYKGENLTAEHFYFHRSIKDIKFLIEDSKNIININKDSIIFEPACGPGKKLTYISDKYKCRGIGIDIYPPAINIAKKIEKFSNCNFLLGNALNSDILSSLTHYTNSKKIDIIFIDSWLNHVYTNKDFDIFLNHIKNIRCKIILIEPKVIDLRALFKTNKILYQRFKGKTQYVILEL